MGWVQEVTVRKWRHSRPFTNDEYQALNMPYCHLLPFIESHQWEKHTVHFDFRSEDWKEWCDYIARSQGRGTPGFLIWDTSLLSNPFHDWSSSLREGLKKRYS